MKPVLPALLGFATLAVSPVLSAQGNDYPNKPVQVIITFPPGGSIDVTSRIVFNKMVEQMGQEFVLDNRGGASGSIGAAVVARSNPDGYTLMAHSATHIANAFVYDKLPYDTLGDFAGITALAKQVLMLVVHPSMPVKNVSDFIRLAKKRPRDINFGTGGKGSSTRLAMALLLNAASIKLVEVPYRGGGPANLALISGETQAMTSTIGSVATFLKNKQVRGLGVTSAKRVKPYPDIPAIGESVPGYEFSAWVGAFAPAGTPQPIIDKLNREMKKALSDPGVSAKLNALTLEPMHMAPAEFDRRLKEDYAKYDKLMKLATQASKR
jgi:tripartite-type tricarboxylate transporter receptor subunit TctC